MFGLFRLCNINKNYYINLRLFKMKKLVSLNDFVMSQYEKRDSSFRKVLEYAEFLNKPLELGMFTPCNKDGDLSIKPYNYDEYLEGGNLNTLCEEYKEALDRVIFKGFTIEINVKKGIIYLFNKKQKIRLSWIIHEKHFFLFSGYTLETIINLELELK